MKVILSKKTLALRPGTRAEYSEKENTSAFSPGKFISDNKAISLLLLTSALVIALMLPLTSQIFSDDVAFSQSVRHLLNTGDLKVSEYTATSSITHIVWGWLFAKTLGFSFSSLNTSVIVLLPILIISFYKSLRYLNLNSTKSLIFTLFFLSIPWIPFLTFTFMSDIPFITLEMLTILFYLKYAKDRKVKYLYFCFVVATVAFLMRQLGLALIAGITISSVVETLFSPRKLKTVVLPLLIPVAALALYQFWLSIPGNKTIPQYVLETQTIDSIKNFIPFTSVAINTRIYNLMLVVHRAINYANQALGLFFPLVAIIAFSNIRALSGLVKRNSKLIFFSTTIAVIVYLLDFTQFRSNYTVGFPLMVYEYESFLPVPWAHLWKYFVIFSIPFWSAIIARAILTPVKFDKQTRFLMITFLCILSMTLITLYSWDRYVMPFLPFVFIFIAKITVNFAIKKTLALTVAAILILDSAQMTKLRLSETGLLYKIGNGLVARGVEPSSIDLNRDQNWDIWFYYEKGVENQIKAVGGDKTKVENYRRFPLPKKNVRYAIYTDRMIKYQNLNINYGRATVIPFKSLFVSSKLTFVNVVKP